MHIFNTSRSLKFLVLSIFLVSFSNKAAQVEPQKQVQWQNAIAQYKKDVFDKFSVNDKRGCYFALFFYKEIAQLLLVGRSYDACVYDQEVNLLSKVNEYVLTSIDDVLNECDIEMNNKNIAEVIVFLTMFIGAIQKEFTIQSKL